MRRSIIACIIVACLFSNACKKTCNCMDANNPDCDNYDPCLNIHPSADFTMNQYNGNFVDPKAIKPDVCDTIRMNGAEFNAVFKKGNKYTWLVGSDTRLFNGSNLKLLFNSYIQDTTNLSGSNSNYYKPIPVTLRVNNNLSTCIGVKDTFITKTKNLVFAKESPWLGKYKGVCDVDGKERVIEMYRYFVNFDPSQNYARTAFVNFPNLLNKDTIIIENWTIPATLQTFKNFWWDTGEDKVYETGLFPNHYPLDGISACKIFVQPTVDGHDYIKITYKYVSLNKQIKYYTFVGYRDF